MQGAKSEQPAGGQRHPAAELSRELIKRVYQHDINWCLSVCSPAITVIGDSKDLFARGFDDVTQLAIRMPKRRANLLVGEIDATCEQPADASAVVVTARFLAASDPTTGEMHAEQNRATFVWILTDEGYRLLHLHTSVPHEPSGADVQGISQETYRYAKMLLDQVLRRSAVGIRDIEGATHYVSDIEVRYIEASRQRSVVHCLNGTIVVRRGFKELVDEFGSSLVTIHRSFAVNPLHVRSVRADVVVLDDGSEVPLPQRRSAEMRQRLNEAIEQAEAARNGGALTRMNTG